MKLESQIEAVLFFKSEPIKIKNLAKILNKDEEEITSAIFNLKQNLENRGLILIEHDDKIQLATSPEMSDLIEGLIKEELSKDLGKAGLETLTTILYQGPISRRDIDYIRGVNSSFILRNLMIRGLIERKEKDGRSFVYQPTFELLQYLGISKVSDLPEFDSVSKEIEESVNEEPENEQS